MADKPEDLALDRAKIQLMQIPNTLYYTTILFSLKSKWDVTIETAKTDGSSIYLNPKWFLNLSETNRIGLLVHELLHVALDHMSRRGNKHPKVWNIAADHVINLSIMDTGKYTLPPGGCLDGRFINMSTEQVYDILIKEYKEDEQAGGPGADGAMVPGGLDIQYPESEEKVEAVKKSVSEIVHRATMIAAGANEDPGIIPGEAAIHLNNIINPKLPWHVILQNHLTGFAKDDFSWSRPNRRYMPEYYLPSAFSESAGHITQAYDISGSVSPEEVSYYVGETSSLMEMLKPEKITVISFDTHIRNIQEVTQNSDIYEELELIGGGGTEIHEVLEWAIDNNPEVLLIFTDGCFRMPGEELYPTCAVVWLIHENAGFEAPFGEVVHYDIGED